MADDDDGPRALGARIQERRTEMGLSVRAAAKQCGISEGTWRHIEKGYPRKDGTIRWISPTSDTLLRIAIALELDPRELRRLAGDHITTATREPIKPIVSRSIDVEDLSDEEFEQVRALVELLKKR